MNISIGNVSSTPLSSISGVEPISSVSNEQKSVFEQMIGGIDKINSDQITSQQEITDVIMGNTDNAHNAMIDLQKAELQMKYATTIRDKVVQGFNKIIDMQI